MRILKVPRNAVTSAKPIRKRFVIHEHHATHLHFDLRLEIAGTGKSWAVPKGPSMDPDDKRLAIAVPDHSLSYFKFEGTLEEGKYGAGEVRIWDSGKYETFVDPQLQYDAGKIVFTFLGKKVRGEFKLVRMSGSVRTGSGSDRVLKSSGSPNPKSKIANPKSANWLLIKADDKFADIDWRLKTILPV